MDPTLDTAILLATVAHAGQVDKGGRPYILHPLRVMARLGFNADEESRIVAVLHDVVEDTHWTLEGICKTGFSPSVVAALDSITRVGPTRNTWTTCIAPARTKYPAASR